MPAQSSENITAVEEAVFSSVAGTDKLHHKLASLSQKVLFSSIDFQPARKALNLQQDTLKSKYIVLNTIRPDKTLAISASASSNKNSQTENEENDTSTMSNQWDGDGLPTPRYVIYPADKLCLDWWPRKVQKVGAGLHNLGNTCFLNATLQCLSYTPPLVNHLLGDEHTNSCKQVGFCMMCELQTHIRRSYENSGHAIKPQSILQKLKVIAKHMHFGRQEDAHEFLRYLVDALQKSCLNGYLKLDKYSRETTVINQIFGGFLRSQVQCMRCKEKSNTYDPYLDISLDIKNVPSLERAFEKYVTAEVLDHDNSYMCTRCQRKVVAEKRFTIHKPSNVLTIQLKRFDYNRYFGKIVRHISFPEKLNLRPYMSIRQGESLMYKLYAVLVHTGHSCTSGHYFAYVRPSNQSWYCMNDSSVTEVSASRVFESEAYMLFYLRCKEKKAAGNFIGPQMPALQTNFRVVNGSHRSPVLNDVGTALQRKNNTLQTLYSPKSLVDTGNSNASKATPLPDKRDKISFGISSFAKADGTKSASDRSTKTGDAKPRIVMQIKNGIVTTIEKPANGSMKVVSKHEEEVSKLVPYTGDSESDQENKSNSICSPPHVHQKNKANSETFKHSETKSDLSSNDDKVVFDQSLNATTSVPGNTHLLETTNRERNNSRDIRSPDRFSLSSSLRHKDLTLKLHSRHSQSKCSPVEKSTSSTVCSTATSVVAIAGVSQPLDTAATVKLKPANLFLPSQESSTSLSSLASATTAITSSNCATDWHVFDKGSISTSTKPEWQPAGWSVISKESLASSSSNSSSNNNNNSSSGNILDETCQEATRETISKSLSDSGIQTTSGNGSSMMECSTSTTVSSNIVDLLPKEHYNQQTSTFSVKEEPKKTPLSTSEIDTGKSSEPVRSKSTIFNTSNVTNVVTSCPTPIVMTTPHNTLVNTTHAETSAVSGRHSHKKHKKHKRKRHKEENRHNRGEIEEEDLDGRSPRKKRHKKHKHKKELTFCDDRIEDPSAAQLFHEKDLKIDSSEYEWVERTKENFSSVDISRNSLISSSSRETVSESAKELLSKAHIGSQANQKVSKETVDSVLSLLQGPAEPPVIPLPSHQRHTVKSQTTKAPRPVVEKGNNGCITEGLTWSTAEGSTKTSVSTVKDNPAKNKILNSNEKSLSYPVGCSSEKSAGSTASTVNRLSSLPSSAQISSMRTDGHSKRHLIDSFSKSLDSSIQPYYHKNQSASYLENRISKSSGRSVLSLAERENKSSGVNEKGALLSAEPNRYSRANMESRHARQSVPSQRWDSHIHDGYKRPTKTPDNHKLYWDGSKSSRVGDELEKCSSRAYGGQVMSWDGGKSLLDQQFERSRHDRYMSHDYNDDYDRGKVKKIKKQRLNHMYRSGMNHFQRLHNERNKEKWRYGQRMQSSPYSQNSYHRPYSHYGHHNQSMPYIGHYNHYMGRHSYRH